MLNFIQPNWPASQNIKAYTTTREGGFSQGAFASFNLAAHVGDDLQAVAKNRVLLREQLKLPGEPVWLDQVHGIEVIAAEQVDLEQLPVTADASFTTQAKVVCVTQTADCLPLLLCDRAGTCVAAVHAGWKGLALGVIEATIKKLPVKSSELLAWMGPAIGPTAFKVGKDVFDEFVLRDSKAEQAFKVIGDNHWLGNMYKLAKQRLANCGVVAVYGGDFCTYTDAKQFYSYRRDQQTGRMSTLIWMDN